MMLYVLLCCQCYNCKCSGIVRKSKDSVSLKKCILFSGTDSFICAYVTQDMRKDVFQTIQDSLASSL